MARFFLWGSRYDYPVYYAIRARGKEGLCRISRSRSGFLKLLGYTNRSPLGKVSMILSTRQEVGFHRCMYNTPHKVSRVMKTRQKVPRNHRYRTKPRPWPPKRSDDRIRRAKPGFQPHGSFCAELTQAFKFVQSQSLGVKYKL